MTNFKRYLTLFIFALFTAFSVHVWATDPAVDDEIFKEEWGGNNIQANAYTFTGTTTWSGSTTGLSYSSTSTSSLLSTATAGVITTDNFFFVKNAESTLTMSGIAIPSNVTGINVSFASNKNIIQCTYSFDNSSYETGATSVNGTQDFDIDCTDETTLYLKFKKTGTSSNARLDDIVITVTEVTGGGATKYTVTLASSGSVTGGTFSASPTSAAKDATVTLTATPATHYSLSSWTVTKEGGGSVSTTTTGTNTATFTMPEANVTVSATFAETPKHTVKFYNNGAELTSERIEVYNGEAIGTLPSLASGDACDETSTTFMGWTASTISTKTSTAPTFINAGTIIDADKNYNAVWAKASPGGGSGTVTASLSELQSAVSGISSGYHSVSFDLSESGDDYSCDATATKSTQPSTSGWMQIGKASDSRYITISTELPGVITNISSSSVYNGSASTWSGTVYYNTSASTTSPKASKAFSSVNAFSLDVEGGAKTGYILFSSAICLGNLSITYSNVSYSDYLTLCGATISAATDYYITSTKDQKVKISIPVSAYNFESASTLNASISGAGFSLVGWTGKAITAGVTLNTEVIVQYLPSAFGTTGNGTLTLSASGAENKTVTIHGRSLPEQFAITALDDAVYYIMPANTAGTANSRKAEPIEVAAGAVKCSPLTHVYTLEGVTSTRYATDGFAVRLKGYNTGKYLKAVGSDGNDFQNTDYTDSDLFEWTLTTSNNETYNVQNFNADVITATRMIRYRSDGHFGNYTNSTGGQKAIQFLEVTASCKPANVVISEITHNSIKITFEGTAPSHTIVIKKAGVTKVSKTVESGDVITGLEASTDYTYTLTPSCSADCAVEGDFSTIAAPITVTLSRDGKTENLGEVANPYTLPASVIAPCEEWTFVGWYGSTYENKSSAPTFVTQATTSGTYYAVYRKTGTAGGTVTDVITYEDLTATTTSYTAFSNVSKTSSAKYAGASALKGTDIIQLNDKSAYNVGLVSTTSGGTVKSVSVAWDSSTKAGNTLYVYGNNTAYTSSSELYSSATDGDEVGTLVKGTSTSVNVAGAGDYTYVGLWAESAVYLSSITIVWNTAASYTYSTTTDCKECTTAGATFKFGNEVSKNTGSQDFTNTVLYSKTNTKPQAWTSSNTAVATVNATSGLVHIVGTHGTTTITVKQALDDSDDPNNVCAVNMSYTLTVGAPSIDVVEVTADDKIIIEHDIDGNSKLVVDTMDTGVWGETANDIFFSKYFEAASNMKLFALYNGTTHDIDLSKLRVRSGEGNGSDTHSWGAKGVRGYVELGTISKLGEEYPGYMLPPFTEIIFWSNNYGSTTSAIANNKELRGCVEMTIDKKKYDIDDMENNTIKGWYCLGDYETFNKKDADGNVQFLFNGDDPLVLERTEDGGTTWTAIDLFGAVESVTAGVVGDPINTTYANVKVKPSKVEWDNGNGNGYIKSVPSGTDGEKYTINGHANTPLNDTYGGYWAMKDYDDATEIPLSTNRYFLTRKNTVKDGSDAVAQNIGRFATLITEWQGKPVGGDATANCYSGEMFSEVGEYNYASYYTVWEKVDVDDEDFQRVGDGTYSIHIDNLAQYSCDNMRICVLNEAGTDTLALVNYKVPIIVKGGTKNTTDPIFTGEGFGAGICQTCDVVILDGATLEASTALSAVKEVRNVEVYAGGTINIDGAKELKVNQLIMRSKEDIVPRAKLASTKFTRTNPEIFFDKRITGRRWYWISLPYDWNTADVYFRNGEPATYGTDWWLREYAGDVRATGDESKSTNWRTVPAGAIKAGKGYLVAVDTLAGHKCSELRFPMDATVLDKDRSSVDVAVNAWGATTSVAPNHLGWNMIGNPYLNDYAATGLPESLTIGELVFNSGTGLYELDKSGNLRYVIIPTKAGGYGFDNYIQVALGTQDALIPFMPYFVQIDGATAGEALNVEFTNGANLRKSPVHRAPKEYMDNPDEDIVWVPISITNIMDEKDETTFLVSDQFTDNYDMMDDLAKWRNQYYQYEVVSTKPVIASRNNDGEMAFNALPDSSALAGIPLNYFAANNGMYTITLEDKYGVDKIDKAILYDAVAKKEHDLKAEGAYEFASDRADNTTRFTLFLSVNRAPKITTGLEHLGYSDGPRKLLIDGNIYIQRGNRIYDITGKQAVHQ